MTLWGIRSGKYGEREALALENNVALIGWEELPDLTGIPKAPASAIARSTDRAISSATPGVASYGRSTLSHR